MTNSRILIVEDEIIVATNLKYKLQNLGYDVPYLVSSGEEAVQKCGETLPDLILMDIELSGNIDGIEACDQIRNRFNIPVIYLSANSDHATLQRVKITEPYGYLIKPVRDSELLSNIEITLYKHKLETRIRESEKKYRQLVENLPVGIYHSTSEGKFLTVNLALVKMLGYESHEELLKVDITSDLYFSQEERIETLKTFDWQKWGPVIVRMKKKDGSELWVEEHGMEEYDAQGNVIFYEGLLRDISKRRQAEAKLKARVTQQETVAKLGQRALAGIELSVLLNEAVALVSKTLELEYCKVLELMPEGKTLLLQAGVGWRDGLVGKATVNTSQNSQAGYTLLSNGPVIVKDLTSDGRFNGPPLLIEHRVVSGLSVIIEGKDKPFGILGAHTKQQRTFNEDDTHFLQSVANILAEAIASKQARETQRKSESFLKTIYDNSATGIFVLDVIDEKDYIYAGINPTHERITGIKSEWIIGKSPKEMPHNFCEEAVDLINNLYNKCIKTRQTIESEDCILIDRKQKWLLTKLTPLFDSNNNIYRLIGTTLNITVRKLAEVELTRLAAAVEHATEIIFITDTCGNFQYVNPAFERITGYSRNEVIGQNPRIMKSGEHDEQFYRNLWDTLNDGKSWSGRFTNKKKDGTFYEEEASISPVRDATGNIINYVAVKRDITQELLLENQLRQSQKMETIGTLAGGVAHDFNNILTVILGNVEFGLHDSNPGDTVYNDLLKIQKAGIQARELVSHLLSFNRQTNFRPKTVNLNYTIMEHLKMLKHMFGENVELKTRLAKNLQFIKADEYQIQQVLMNLCINSLDAMSVGGSVIFETQNVTANSIKHILTGKDKARNYVLLSVIDAGVGMDKETQARIFEPFFTTKELGKGTGLGFAVVYGIVKQHSGHLEVSSNHGNGTTFNIYFPAITKPKSSRQRKKDVAEIWRGNETVLVVENEEAVRNVTFRLLTSMGYSVLTAENSFDALKTFKTRQEKIDLVILDVILPQSSGPEIYQQLRAIKPDLSALFVTGYDLNAKLDELDELVQKQVKILQKPFTREALGKKVRELLSK